MSGSTNEKISAQECALAAVLIAAGAGLRIWGALHSPGFWYDEALYAVDGLRVLREPGWPLGFVAEGHSREPLFIYMLALAFKLFGTSIETARLTAATVGTITLPIFWLLGRALFGRRGGIVVLALGAFFAWHLHFSSLCFRTITAPLFAAVAGLALHAFWTKPSSRNAVLAGLAFGAGTYTYLAWRLVPLFCVAFVAYAWWAHRRRGAAAMPALKQLLLAGGVALAVAAPMGVYALRNWDSFTGRLTSAGLPGTREEQGALLAAQARDVALMYAIRGDHEPKHNLPGRPQFLQARWTSFAGQEDAARWSDARAAGTAPDVHGTGLPVFDVLTGAFFYLGLGLCIWRAAKRGALVEGALVAWLAMASLASVLSFGAPNMLRMTLAIPAVLGVLAVGLLAAADFARERFGAKAATALLVALVVQGSAIQTRRFLAWPTHPGVASHFNPDLAAIGREVVRLHSPEPVVIPAPMHDTPNIQFICTGEKIASDATFDPASAPNGWIEVRTAFLPTRVQHTGRIVETKLAELKMDGRVFGEMVRCVPAR